MEVTLQNLNLAAAATHFVVKSFFPHAAVVTGEVAVITQVGTTATAVINQSSQVELLDSGYGVGVVYWHDTECGGCGYPRRLAWQCE